MHVFAAILVLGVILVPFCTFSYRLSSFRCANAARRLVMLRDSSDAAVVTSTIVQSVDESTVDLAFNATIFPSKYLPIGTPFCYCTSCKTAYVLQEKSVGKGRRVKCTICNKDWFQTPDKLMIVDEFNHLTELSNGKMQEVRRILADNDVPKKPRNDFTEVFVGNLDFRLGEQDIANLFREYGVSHVSLSKDKEGSSRGFAFVEFLTKEDADQAVAEMNGFYTDARRKLTVRMSEKQAERAIHANKIPPGPSLGEKTHEPQVDGKLWSKDK